MDLLMHHHSGMMQKWQKSYYCTRFIKKKQMEFVQSELHLTNVYICYTTHFN
jgi:hypothetical protein